MRYTCPVRFFNLHVLQPTNNLILLVEVVYVGVAKAVLRVKRGSWGYSYLHVACNMNGIDIAGFSNMI